MAEREAPLPAPPVEVEIQVPPGMRVTKVVFRTPEEDQERRVEFRLEGRRLGFTTPGFLVGGLCEIQ